LEHPSRAYNEPAHQPSRAGHRYYSGSSSGSGIGSSSESGGDHSSGDTESRSSDDVNIED